MKNTCRILAFLMAALMLLLAFTACGKKDQEPSAAFVFSHNGVDIKIGDSDSVIEKLGNWKLVNSTEYCGGFAGKEYTYTYEGFNIYTVPNQNGNVINMIELTSDAVKLPNGLTIGSTRKEVVKAMGSEGTAQGSGLVYTSGMVKLTFIMRDDVVTNIQYTSTV